MPPNKRICLWTLLICFNLTLAARADIKVGDTFPDLASCQLEGNLPDMPKDRVVLVDFWASWCGPCAQSFPAMEALRQTYGARGLVIIAVSVDEKKDDMDNFLRKHSVTFSIVRDAGQKLVGRADISAMPSSFLIDKHGRVMFVHNGYHGAETKKQYASEIELLLKPDHQ